MRFATVAETKNGLSSLLERAHRRREPILVTRHGKPYALIRPIESRDLEGEEWSRLARRALAKAWAGDDDRYYDYLK